MTTAHRHELIRRQDQLESAQTRLDECKILQAEIREKLERVFELTGVRIAQFQDLEDVGDLEELVEGME